MTPFPPNPELSEERRAYNTDAAYLLRAEKLRGKKFRDWITLPIVVSRLRGIVAAGNKGLADRAQELLDRRGEQQFSEQTLVGSTRSIDFKLGSGENIKVPCKVHNAKRTTREGSANTTVRLLVTPIGGRGAVWVNATRASKH